MSVVKPIEYDSEEYNKIGLPATLSESLAASTMQSAFGTAGVDAAKLAIISQLQYSNDPAIQSPVLSKEELNARYPGMDYKEEMPVLAAAAIYAHKTQQAKWQNTMARGPQGFFQGTALPFAAAAIPHMFDPLEYGGGVLTAGAFNSIGKAFVGANATSKIGAALLTQEGGAGIAATMAEGAIGNLATAPINLAAAKEMQDDFTAYEAFTGAVGAAVGFTAAAHGLSATWKFVKAKGSKPASVVMKNVLGRLEAGKKVDVKPIIQDLQADIHTKTVPYEYTRTEPANAKSIPWHAAGETIDRTMTSGNSFGPGTTEVFSDPNVAHGIAGSRIEGNPSNVMEVSLGNKKLIRLDSPIMAQDAPAIKAAFENTLGFDVFKRYEGKFNSLGELTRLIDTDIEAGKVSHYKYDFIQADPSGIEGKTFYHGTKAPLENISKADPLSFSSPWNLYGEGIYLSDNPNISKTYAGRKGKVLSGKLKDTRLLNLERPLPEKAWNIFKEMLLEHTDKETVETMRNDPGKTVFTEMQALNSEAGLFANDMVDIYQRLNSKLIDAGYNGLYHVGGEVTGSKLGKHNVVIMFGNDKFGTPNLDQNVSDMPMHSQDSYKEKLNGQMKEAGFDGYLHSEGDGVTGEKAKYDTAVLFDHEGLTVNKAEKARNNYEPAPEQVRQYGEETLSERSNEDYHPELVQKFQEAEKYQIPKLAELNEELVSKQEQAKYLAENELATPEQKKMFEEANQESLKEEKFNQAVKDAIHCLY